MTNKQRAERAREALNLYELTADESNLRDLVCDLRHLADETGQDWEKELQIAMDNYNAEMLEDW